MQIVLIHRINQEFTLLFLLSHHSPGLAKNAFHVSTTEPVLFAALLTFLPETKSKNIQQNTKTLPS